MVEGAPLLREYTRKGIEGSNPFLSAIFVCALPPANPKRNGSRFGLRPLSSAILTGALPPAVQTWSFLLYQRPGSLPHVADPSPTSVLRAPLACPTAVPDFRLEGPGDSHPLVIDEPAIDLAAQFTRQQSAKIGASATDVPGRSAPLRRMAGRKQFIRRWGEMPSI